MKSFLLLCLTVIGLLSGCKEDFEKQLQTIAFQKSDSIFSAQIENYKTWTDSVCANFTNQNLTTIVDSILSVRREQVRQLRTLE